MTLMPIAGEAVTENQARVESATAPRELPLRLREAAEFLGKRMRHPRRVLMNIPVEGATLDEKLADLRQIAADLGVSIAATEGTLSAEIWFGEVQIEARVSTGALPCSRHDPARPASVTSAASVRGE